MRIRSAAALLVLALAAAACQSAPLPRAELRAGLGEEAVAKLVGREPVRVSSFSVAGQPGPAYRVQEFFVAPRKDTPETRHWFLFREGRLIGYGTGGVAQAKTLALDTYFGWMADHDQMRRGAAERRLLARLRDLYGANLNPMVEDYFAVRIAVMDEADSGKTPTALAERTIAARFAKAQGINGPGPAPDPLPGQSRRYTALLHLGVDLQSSRWPSRPRAGKSRRLLSCARGAGASGCG